MKHRIASTLAVTLTALGLLHTPAAVAAKAAMPQVCSSCHQPSPGNLRGLFENVAFKSGAIQLKIDAQTEILSFDPRNLAVIDAGVKKPTEALREIAKGKEARVEFTERDGTKVATLIAFKGPISVAPEKLIGYDEVARLVALGPEAGDYTLIDSRPLPRVQEGTIPTAVNLPYPAFDKFVDRLPPDKSRLTIFFCQGVTCMMSPNSMKRAESLGYTNVRVYREGYPEWLERNVGVIAPAHLKEAWIDKQVPHVLIDARPASTARAGYIPRAVSLPPSAIRAALPSLPDPKQKAPIIVYDVDGGTASLAVASVLKQSGQGNVTVLTGGMDGWQRAKLPVATGEMATKIAYAPKPRTGSVAADEFARLASIAPADVLILDVRNAAEAKLGMIKGAKLLPEEEVAARMTELPKDKRIVTHCATGVRAEMAYHRLKDAGYDVAFLNADVDVGKDGTFRLTPH